MLTGSFSSRNLTTPDKVVHGVVKQSNNYAFVRVYNAGHSVPFYKPLAALTMFERMLNHTDIATGAHNASTNYKSQGPAKSSFYEGGSTIQYNVTDPSCTYDRKTNVPRRQNASN